MFTSRCQSSILTSAQYKAHTFCVLYMFQWPMRSPKTPSPYGQSSQYFGETQTASRLSRTSPTPFTSESPVEIGLIGDGAAAVPRHRLLTELRSQPHMRFASALQSAPLQPAAPGSNSRRTRISGCPTAHVPTARGQLQHGVLARRRYRAPGAGAPVAHESP